MDAPRRYHPLLVALHWLVAILVALNLYLGIFIFIPHGHTDPTLAVHMASGIAVLALVITRFGVRLRAARPAEATSGSVALDIFANGVHYALYTMLIATTVVGVIFAVRTNHFQEAFLGAEEPAGAPANHFHPEPAITPLPTFTPVPTATEAASEADEYNEYYGRDSEAEPSAAPATEPQARVADAAPEGAQHIDRTGFLLQGWHFLSARILLALIGMHVLAALYHQVVRRDNLLSRMWFGPR